MKRPVHIDEVPAETWYVGTDREIRGQALCDAGGRAKIGFGLMELAAGCHTGPAHWHSEEEEHLYVLSGEGVVRLGDERFAVRSGSYVCFPAGQAAFHHVENPGPEPLRYIIVGERIGTDRVTHERD